MLIRISSKYFVAGVVTRKISTGMLGWEDNEYYNTCAPILKYMKTWSPSRIRNYCKYKGWRYEPL